MAVINLTEKKYFIYSAGGRLRNRVNYNDIRSPSGETVGSPVEVSPNGRLFIFHRPEQPSYIYIFALTHKAFKYVKEIDIKEQIERTLADQKKFVDKNPRNYMSEAKRIMMEKIKIYETKYQKL